MVEKVTAFRALDGSLHSSWEEAAAVQGAAIFAAMIASDAISWQMVPYVFGPIVVIGLSLRKGLKLAHMRGETVSWRDAFMDWSRKDTICVSLVAAAFLGTLEIRNHGRISAREGFFHKLG